MKATATQKNEQAQMNLIYCTIGVLVVLVSLAYLFSNNLSALN